jgi:predicted phosphoadenosine phosphosulfate sulfurtransferase
VRRRGLGSTVFDAALERLIALYDEGHRLVISFSGGKDSTCVLNIAILAARATGRLPVEVILRDEEIIFPGTYEYAERVAQRPEVSFNWVYANQPIINVFNRANPTSGCSTPCCHPAPGSASPRRTPIGSTPWTSTP